MRECADHPPDYRNTHYVRESNDVSRISASTGTVKIRLCSCWIARVFDRGDNVAQDGDVSAFIGLDTARRILVEVGHANREL